MSEQLVRGSLQDVAASANKSLSEAFLNARAVILFDNSSSMDIRDCGERRRFDAAVEQLVSLQREYPGQIALIQWSSDVRFVPAGWPDQPTGTTNLAAALKFIQPLDNTGVRLILISDGEPDSESESLSVASRFQSKIDTIYCGPETGSGRDFLRRLAAATGGIAVSQSVRNIPELQKTIVGLLAA